MTASALTIGKLYGEPITRPTKTGGQVTSFKLKVANGASTEFWSVATFSDAVREEVVRLVEGAPLSAVGALSVETYVGKDGKTRPSLKLLAERKAKADPGDKVDDPRAGPEP
jgi:hypothetical protein